MGKLGVRREREWAKGRKEGESGGWNHYKPNGRLAPQFIKCRQRHKGLKRDHFRYNHFAVDARAQHSKNMLLLSRSFLKKQVLAKSKNYAKGSVRIFVTIFLPLDGSTKGEIEAAPRVSQQIKFQEKMRLRSCQKKFNIPVCIMFVFPR